MKKKVSLADEKQTPRRSDASKARILEAARSTFAELGYDRATIRTIAERANIHPSMVMRYFASKEGLFTAASQFDLGLPDFSKVPSKQLGQFIIRTFLDRWEKRRGTADMPALLRLSVTHPEGREKAIAVFTKQVKPLLTRVIQSRDAPQRAALIATQLVGLAFLRYVLRLPAVVELSDAYLVEQMGSAIQRCIEDGKS